MKIVLNKYVYVVQRIFINRIRTTWGLPVHCTDTVTWWVSKCQRLETVELFEDRNVTPVGYAQLLR